MMARVLLVVLQAESRSPTIRTRAEEGADCDGTSAMAHCDLRVFHLSRAR
jgi:hypothetical protein